jgi:uncharacterized protein YutE (UPF0331/DUF86 family)
VSLELEALDLEVAVARLRRIDELVRALEERLPRVARSARDSDAWLAAERLLEQALRTAARLAAQLVAAGALGAPESEAEMFETLGGAGLLAASEAEALAALCEDAEALETGDLGLEKARELLARAPALLRAFLRACARQLRTGLT